MGDSGDGKTTATIVNPDGTVNLDNYQGLDPKTHFVINLDRKDLPFPAGMWGREQKNYAEPTNFDEIRKILMYIAAQPHIQTISIDTLNCYLAMKEFNERKRLSYDQWRDIANDVIELNILCNTILRADQIVFIMGHTMMITQPDGTEKKVFSVIGKKSQRQPPESFYSIVLMTRVEYGDYGDNQFWFQTKAAHSSAKTPPGMFTEFEIPNSLALVKEKISKYYNINQNPQNNE